MRNLEASPWLEAPTLVEVKATKPGKENIILNEFILNVSISRPQEEAAGAKPGAPPAASRGRAEGLTIMTFDDLRQLDPRHRQLAGGACWERCSFCFWSSCLPVTGRLEEPTGRADASPQQRTGVAHRVPTSRNRR
jgi:hypothetical protein